MPTGCDIASHTPEYALHARHGTTGTSTKAKTLDTMPENPDGDVLTAVTTLVAELKAGGLSPRRRRAKLEDADPPGRGHALPDARGTPVGYRRQSASGTDVRQAERTFTRPGTRPSSEAARKWSYTEWQEQIDRLTDDEATLIQAGEPQDWLKETHAICVGIYEDSAPKGRRYPTIT